MMFVQHPTGAPTYRLGPESASIYLAAGWRQVTDPDLANLKVDELRALAGERGIDLGSLKRRSEIIAALG